MRKLIESTLVSLDGVIESPERWAIFDEEATQRSMQELDNYDAFVTLLRARLVDELQVWIMPVVVGSGQRIFEDVEASSLKLTLTDVSKAPQRLGRPHLRTRLTATRTQ